MEKDQNSQTNAVPESEPRETEKNQDMVRKKAGPDTNDVGDRQDGEPGGAAPAQREKPDECTELTEQPQPGQADNGGENPDEDKNGDLPDQKETSPDGQETAGPSEQSGEPEDTSGADNGDGSMTATGFFKGKSKKKGCLIYSLIITVVSVLLAFFILLGINDMAGFIKPDKVIRVSIPAGASNGQVADQLKKDGVISNDLLFKFYLKVKKEGGFQRGTYDLNSSMGYAQIVETMKSAANNKAVVRVVVPEGYTLRQIGETLESKKVCKKSAFLSAVESAGIKFDYMSDVPYSQNRFYHLEGYLFPDTYEFYTGESATSVAQIMLKNFKSKFNSAYLARAKQINMTMDQVVTLASIIQAEASKTDEMSKVSSVFHNRLTHGVDGRKVLESDATIFYVKRNIQPVLKDDSKYELAYNTYKHEQLPPGAICNPGIAAIKAALYPDTTSYYFFVTDSENHYYYSQTYAQHQIAVRKAMKSGSAIGTDVGN
ncbi:MAG TPA: endolytic transglycosylase MltG [Clostridia bacterium]|nr:endolytic transglycosylase MltG [Clostridia bacterium]